MPASVDRLAVRHGKLEVSGRKVVGTRPAASHPACRRTAPHRISLRSGRFVKSLALVLRSRLPVEAPATTLRACPVER